MIKGVINISSKTTRQWRSILLIYVMQLSFGLFVAIFAYDKIKNGLGTSLELDRLSNGFDRSIFSDMMNQLPKLISAIQSRFVITGLVFFIFSIFLHAGLLGNIKRREYSIRDFLNNSKNYFLKFTLIALVSICKMCFIIALIWIPFVKWMGDPLQTFHSEKTFILTSLVLVVFTVLLIIVVWLWSVLSRFNIIEGKGFIMAMKTAWSVLKSSFAKYYIIGLLVILFHIMITWLYTFVVDDWGAATWFCVIGLVLIQQIFSLVRIWLRAFAYSYIDEI